MAKNNFTNTEKELYTLLEQQTKRLNFLTELSSQVENDEYITPSLETECIDNGFAQLLEEIKFATRETVLKLIKKQISEEKEAIKNIMKQLM